MKLYEGTLSLLKTTRSMCVFGNADLRAQYLPKCLFENRGKNFPPKIVFRISVPENASQDKATE